MYMYSHVTHTHICIYINIYIYIYMHIFIYLENFFNFSCFNKCVIYFVTNKKCKKQCVRQSM